MLRTLFEFIRYIYEQIKLTLITVVEILPDRAENGKTERIDTKELDHVYGGLEGSLLLGTKLSSMLFS